MDTKLIDKQVSNSIGSIQRDTIDVVKQMELGTEQAKRRVTQAEQAGESLSLIVEGFEVLNNMIESIASTAVKQSKAAQVMAQGVTDITNSSSAIVTKKSIEMKSLANELSSIVRGFNLSNCFAYKASYGVGKYRCSGSYNYVTEIPIRAKP